MNSQRLQKQVMERNIKALKRRPELGLGRVESRFEVDEDGRCTVMEDGKQLVIDMGEEYGGKGATPSPGFYVRAAFGACLTMGYRIWAAYLDVPIDRISVELHTGFDMRGNLGIDDSITGGFTEFRYIIEIESAAPREKVEEVIERSDAVDFVRCIFAEEVPMQREIRIVEPQPA